MVKEALSRADVELIKLAAQKTAKDPKSLGLIDVSQPESRHLWSVHIDCGGAVFPKNLQNTGAELKLLNSLILGEETFGLIRPLTEYLPQFILEHPDRKLLWSKLEKPELDVLLFDIAAKLIRAIENGQKISQPESELIRSILNILRKDSPSARIVCAALEWPGCVNEDDIIAWVKPFSAADWNATSESIGKAALKHNWVLLAKELERISKATPEAKLAADACTSLIPSQPAWPASLFFDLLGLGQAKPQLPTESHSYPAQLDNQKINQIIDIGANLYPEGPGYIWERAGGDISKLQIGGSGQTQWQYAVRLAVSGAIPNGLSALIKELRQGFPDNPELKIIENTLGAL